MSSAAIKNRHWTEAERQTLRRLSQSQSSHEDAAHLSGEIPPLTAEQLDHLVRFRPGRTKVAVSVRLDPEVLSWLKSKGEGHLTRINNILANLMEVERAATSPRS